MRVRRIALILLLSFCGASTLTTALFKCPCFEVTPRFEYWKDKIIFKTSAGSLTKTNPVECTLPGSIIPWYNALGGFQFPVPNGVDSVLTGLPSAIDYKHLFLRGGFYVLPPPVMRKRVYRSKPLSRWEAEASAKYNELLKSRDVNDICYNTDLSKYPDEDISKLDDVNIRIQDRKLLLKQLNYFLAWDDFRSVRTLLAENPHVLHNSDALTLLRSFAVSFGGNESFASMGGWRGVFLEEAINCQPNENLFDEWSVEPPVELQRLVNTISESAEVSHDLSYTPFTRGGKVYKSHLFTPAYPYKTRPAYPSIHWVVQNNISSSDVPKEPYLTKEEQLSLNTSSKYQKFSPSKVHKQRTRSSFNPSIETNSKFADTTASYEEKRETFRIQAAVDARYSLLHHGLKLHGALDSRLNKRPNYWRIRNMPRDLSLIRPDLLPPAVVDQELKTSVNLRFREAVQEKFDLKTSCLILRKYTNLIELRHDPKLVLNFLSLLKRVHVNGNHSQKELKLLRQIWFTTVYKNRVLIKLSEVRLDQTADDEIAYFNRQMKRHYEREQRNNYEKWKKKGIDLNVFDEDFSEAVGTFGRGTDFLAEKEHAAACGKDDTSNE